MNKLIILLSILIISGLFFGCTQTTVEQTTDTNINNTDNNSTIYTLSDISKHNNSSDCWTAINGNAYDLTPFVSSHPGGPIIATICGIDGSILYNLRPNTKGAPHPAQADTTLAKYLLGPLAN